MNMNNCSDKKLNGFSFIKSSNNKVKSRRVILLMGGWSSERDVSLETGRCVLQSLKDLGHEIVCIDPKRNLGEFIQDVNNAYPDKSPDVVFNGLHGKWGEDGTVQGILETLSIPYTSSGVLASALAMNKKLSRQIAHSKNIRTAPGQVLTLGVYKENGYLYFPHILKPVTGGSSVGVFYIQNEAISLEVIKKLEIEGTKLSEEILIENFIPGRELTVSVFNGEAMGVLEMRFPSKFYDYVAKYTTGKSDHITPAPVHPEIYQLSMIWAVTMHKTMNCRGVTRSDFRYDDTKGEPGHLYYLETNSQPGLTSISLVPDTASALYGWKHKDLVQWILEDASVTR